MLSPEARGKGYGREAFRLGRRLAREPGMTELLLTCVKDNPASINTLAGLPYFRRETAEAVVAGEKCAIERFYFQL